MHLNFKNVLKFKTENLKRDFYELKNRIATVDIFIVAILPFIMAILMVLPINIRDLLKLNINNPSWWQFFTSSFIHANIEHYLNNMNLFFLLIFFQIIIISNMKEKRRFFFLCVFMILSFPLISSIIQVSYYPSIYPKIETSEGASGIVAAFLGFIPVVWIEYLSRSIKKDLSDANFFCLILLSVVLMFVSIYYPYHKNLLVVFIILGLILVFIYSYRKNLKEILKCILNEKNRFFYFMLFFLPIFFLVMLIGLFPIKLISENGFVDFGTHYLGIVYGFVISFIFFKVEIIKETANKFCSDFFVIK